MKISVIIPTYKPKEYIWECLNSLTKQTFSKSDFEVIIVLNGCNEPWRGEIEKFVSTNMKGMNVIFLQTNQAGVSNARNIGIDSSKGEYITFIDDDDFVSPSYLEELYSKSSPDTIASCCIYCFNDGNLSFKVNDSLNSEYERRNKYGKQFYTKTRKIFSGPYLKLIHKNIISDRRFDPNFKNGEDSLFMFLISDRFKYVEYTSENAIYYRRFRQNSAYTMKKSTMYDIVNCLNLIKSYSLIYWSKPLEYNFYFYFTRLLGAFKAMMVSQFRHFT